MSNNNLSRIERAKKISDSLAADEDLPGPVTMVPASEKVVREVKAPRKKYTKTLLEQLEEQQISPESFLDAANAGFLKKGADRAFEPRNVLFALKDAESEKALNYIVARLSQISNRRVPQREAIVMAIFNLAAELANKE